MKKIILLVVLAFITCASSAAVGYVFGGSNLPFTGYPEFSESPPSAPFDHDRYSIETYSDEVKDFIVEAKEYIENANSDIERIKEAIEEVRQSANDAADEYNDWVRSPY